MIPVSKAFLPPLHDYEQYLKKIFASGIVTNNGPLAREFEAKMKEHLQVKHVFFVSSGTTALQLALLALDVKDTEVITSAFSFVAATDAILLNAATPVFADCDPQTFCMSADGIEELITSRTSVILPTHIFGSACDVTAIAQIAERHSLKLVYDAAHSFGTMYEGRPLFLHGDISVTSLHAYKIFHTVEGGLVMTNDDSLAEKIYQMRYFGMDENLNCKRIGMNGKSSEVNAAMGLANFNFVQEMLEKRAKIFTWYREEMNGMPVKFQQFPAAVRPNYSYVSIMFENEKTVLEIIAALAGEGISSKRYFNPSLARLPFVKAGNALPHAEEISSRVLCLPSYHDLQKEQVIFICSIIKNIICRN